MNNQIVSTKRLYRGLLLMSALFLAFLPGCAAKQVKRGTTFYPPPPNQPRVQFLMGISSSKDVLPEKTEWSLVVTGATEADEIKVIKKPYGVAVYNGKIYVCDSGQNTIVIIDLPNKKFAFLKGNVAFGKLKKPINMAFDKSGNLFVTDSSRKEVLMYDPAGNFVKTYGKGMVEKPTDVLADNNFVYILDFSKSDIKVIDRKSGALERTIGKTTEEAKGLSLPTNFTMDDKGLIYVTNTGSGSIVKMDIDGHVLQSIGSLGDGFGQFTRPKGISVDQDGRIFVADSGHQNVQVFNESGRLLLFFGDPTAEMPPGSMTLPAGLTTTRENLDYFQKLAAPGFIVEEVVMVANQFGRDLITIYGLGKMKDDTSTDKPMTDIKNDAPQTDKKSDTPLK